MPSAEKELTMKFAGGLVKHLGLQMYGGAVPAIAELISNAWDADASEVRVSFPFDQDFSDDSRIVIKDTGSGMSFDECNERYLVLGRNRRKSDGEKTPCGRYLHGKKGIGKLAGFGIANSMMVRTVKDGHLTKFRMDYDTIQQFEFGGDYHPTILHDEAESTSEKNGTTIILEGIKLVRQVSMEEFVKSMSRRFSIFSDTFRVWINDIELKKFHVDLEYYFPDKQDMEEGVRIDDDGWGTADVAGKEVKWWIGFTAKPIPDEESMGISVLARDKLAQKPWFFDLVRGATGQLGMPSMLGEIKADFLDPGGEEDHIATSRDHGLWEHPEVRALKDWGLEMVKKYLNRRNEYRIRDNEAALNADPIQKEILTLPDEIQDYARGAVDKVKNITTLDKEEAVDLATFMIDALHHKHLITLIHQINAASTEDKKRVFQLVSSWSVVDAICLSIVIKGRVGIIEKFEKMLEEKAKEKPDMHDILKTHPWLIDPAMDQFRHEAELDRILTEELNSPASGSEDKGKEPDFFCMQSAHEARVVEVKRPGVTAGKKELRQIDEYVHVLREYSKNTTDPQHKLADVTGVLIASRIDPNQSEKVKSLAQARIYVWDWPLVLRRAKNLYREYFDLVVSRGPKESPVIKALNQEQL